MEEQPGGDPRADHLAKGVDALSLLLHSVSADIKTIAGRIGFLDGDVRLLAYKVEEQAREHTKALQTSSTNAIRLTKVEERIRDIREDLQEAKDWIDQQGRMIAEAQKVLAEAQRTIAHVEEAKTKIEEENSKRRWGFWGAIGTALAALAAAIANWLSK